MRSHSPGPTPSPAPFAPCPYAINDGAYILGALAPAERVDFERHLAVCPPCRDSMTHLAVLPGLLGRLDPQTAQRSTTAPSSLLPRVLAAMRARRAAARRRRLLASMAGVVAAIALATVVGIGVQLINRPAPDPFTYRPMTVGETGPRIDAEIGLQEQAIGTVVSVRCLYHGRTDRTWLVWLVVYPRNNEDAEPIGSWVATGGELVEVTAITHHAPADIARIELQTPTQTTIAWWSP